MVLFQNLELELQGLLKEKKYSEIINIILSRTNLEERSAGILNILGVCKTLEKPNDTKNLSQAIYDFKIAFLREKKTPIGQLALANFIKASCDLSDLQKSEINFNEIITFYEESKCENNGEVQSATVMVYRNMARVYGKLNENKKSLFLYDKILKSNLFNSYDLCSYMYLQCFETKWKQPDFFNFGKFIDKNLKHYPDEKLLKLVNGKKTKIRIGFLSADIRNGHSITYFLKTILSNYDKDKFEIYLILNQKNEDRTANYFKTLVDKTINIINKENVEAINIVRNLEIDICIDLMGMLSDHRIELFKNRIAPDQILWLGYCNTTGLKNMDYIISDHNLILKNEQNLYSEEILYLPSIWNCHSGFDIKREQVKPPMIKNNFITFGSFNNLDKINDETVIVWSEILRKIKNSKLMIKSSINRNNNRLNKLFSDNGVIDSIIFIDRKKEFEDHMNLYRQIDIALDTFPYNGVTTSFEAIWMGVPVLTMKGFNFNSRCGESINRNINMDYMIAENKEEYISKAIELFEKPERLGQIRDEIFQNSISSSLFDINNFSNDFFKILSSVFDKQSNAP